MKIKNILLTFMLICIFMPTSVFAHPGRLDSSGCHVCKTNCAGWGLMEGERHCHSGNTYSNSKGQTFNSDGTKISDGNSSNSSSNGSSTGTDNSKTKTDNYYNNNNNSYSDSSNNYNSNNTQKNNVGSNYNNNYQTNTYNNSSDSETEKTKKSNNTNIKKIEINGKKINISDEITTKTTKKNIKLKITPEDKRTKVEYQLKELNIGKNIIKINLTAEDGTKKEYKLIVEREKGKGTATIIQLNLGANEVEFKDNKATITILHGEKINDYSYKLSSKKAKLKLYINDKEVTKIEDIKDNDKIKIVVIDEDDNELEYKIKVEEEGPIISAIINIIVYGIVAVILIGPIIVIIFIVKKIKKHSKS